MIEQEEFNVENLDGYSDATGKPLKRSVLKRAPALRKNSIRERAKTVSPKTKSMVKRSMPIKAGQGRGSAPVKSGKVSGAAPLKRVAKPAIKRSIPVKRPLVSTAVRKPAPAKRVAVKKAPINVGAPVIPVKKSLNPIIGNQKITIPAKGDYIEEQPVKKTIAVAVQQPVSQPAYSPKQSSTGIGTGLRVITKNDIIIEGDEKYDSAEGKPKSNLTKALISVAVIGVVSIFIFKFIK